MTEKKEKQYVSDNAQLMAEWDWEKNSELGVNPNHITHQSNKKVWWICEKGHEWQAIVSNRNKGNGCPYCAGRYATPGYNDLQTVNPALAKEWNYDKNKGVFPLDVLPNSAKKVWWMCSKGHEWRAIIEDRNKGNGCPYCAGQKIIQGYNDLQTVNPTLAKEWNYEKNNELTPISVFPNSNKKVWWMCSEGHEWQASINHRSNGRNCPYCAGKKVLVGYNDLQTINPILSKEWNYGKNTGVTPTDVSPNSDKKMWWKCRNGHEWQATISSRNVGSGCPYCAGQKVIQGYNDLQTINPILSKEWNYEKNNGLTPMDVFSHSIKKAWWICSNGHEWHASISNRNKGHGCPYCAGQKVIQGYNDLQTLNPTLAKEWNYEKNNRLTPADIMSSSGKKVWWRCSKGHEWQAKIAHRSNGVGCPICDSERKTSFPEYAIRYYLEKYGLEVIHSYKELGYEMDIYIPSQKIAIEYDGYFFHKERRDKDLEKNRNCVNDGIKLYRIREEGLPSLNDSSIDYIATKDLQKTLKDFLSVIIGDDLDINLERDTIAIENLREYSEKENSILFYAPELATEWNYKKNGNLRPENFTVNSGKKVWWVCQKGHEWQTTVAHRNDGTGCPYCSNKKVLKGYNDFQTLNPILSQEWDWEKNGNLRPENFVVGSAKKVWWKCSQGHKWESQIRERVKGSGCPYCSGRYAIKGENDLKTVNPTLANEWNYEKNDELTPMGVLPNSNKKVWWKCGVCGHEWEALICNRSNGRGCPECAKQKRKKKGT